MLDRSLTHLWLGSSKLFPPGESYTPKLSGISVAGSHLELRLGHLHCASESKPLFPGITYGIIWESSGQAARSGCCSGLTSLVPCITCHISWLGVVAVFQGSRGWAAGNSCYSRSTFLIPGNTCNISQLGVVAVVWGCSSWGTTTGTGTLACLGGWALPVPALLPGWGLGELPVQVIFPSCFCTNSLQCCIMIVETIYTSFNLHMSLCLLLLSMRLLMDLTLACKRSLSAFLIIFLAFSVLTVVFNLILTGAIPLLMHPSGNIGDSCSCKTLDMPSLPNLTTPCTFLQILWSMLREHLCLNMHIEPPRTYIRHWISVLLQTWCSWTVGWILASLIATNVLFKRIYQLLNDTTEWEIYTE